MSKVKHFSCSYKLYILFLSTQNNYPQLTVIMFLCVRETLIKVTQSIYIKDSNHLNLHLQWISVGGSPSGVKTSIAECCLKHRSNRSATFFHSVFPLTEVKEQMLNMSDLLAHSSWHLLVKLEALLFNQPSYNGTK